MGSAARAYMPERRQREVPAPSFEVLPGRGEDAARRSGLSPQAVFAFKIVIAVAVFLGIVCGVRVWLTAATVGVLMDTQTLTASVSEARALGSELEVQQSILANPTRIQSVASEDLGMGPASQVAYLDVSSAKADAAEADDGLSADALVRVDE